MKFTKQYLSILSSDLKGLNLTRIIEPKEFHEKQYLDSIIPFQISTELSLENQLHVDVGFGGGFPCLPLAYEFSSLNFRTIGIEAREKKVKAVNLIAKKMNLNKFTGYHARVEDIIFDQKCLVTFKAVGKISKFLSMMNVSNLDLKVIFYKGPGLSDLEPDYNTIKGWKLIEKKDYEIACNIRNFLVYRPVSLTKVSNKRLVNLSSIMSNK